MSYVCGDAAVMQSDYFLAAGRMLFRTGRITAESVLLEVKTQKGEKHPQNILGERVLGDLFGLCYISSHTIQGKELQVADCDEKIE